MKPPQPGAEAGEGKSNPRERQPAEIAGDRDRQLGEREADPAHRDPAEPSLLGGRRRPMIFLCFGGVIPFIIVLATLKIGVPAYVLLLTLTGAGFFSNMVWGPALSIPADLFSAEVYGKAIGFTNCIGYMLAAACPSIMGLLIRTDPVTHVVSYFWAWLYIALAACGGIIAACFLVDRKVVR